MTMACVRCEQSNFSPSGTCRPCGNARSQKSKRLHRDRLTRDHKIPLSRGGSHYIVNIVPACKPCNSQKHDLTAQEFFALRAGLLCRIGNRRAA